MGKDGSCRSNFGGTIKNLNGFNFIENPIFFGRRKGRKLSISGQVALKEGKRYFVHQKDFKNILNSKKHIILEIGFGDGDNLINSAKTNSDIFYIGADPFLNTTAKCFERIIKYNIKNIVIWPDDVRKIINLFPKNSIAEIKILFPDPWPKKKHISRRLIQDDFLEIIHLIIKPNGIITIATDHNELKCWILEKFQKYEKFEWIAKSSKDWETRPNNCFQTKYELKSIIMNRKPSWFIFKKM